MPDLTSERDTAIISRAADARSRGVGSSRPDVTSRTGPPLPPPAPGAQAATLRTPGWPFRVHVSHQIVASYVDNRTARLAVNAVLGSVFLNIDTGTVITLLLREFASDLYNLVPILPVAESKATALGKKELITPAADMARLGFTPCAFYRHSSGVILPTILNVQTLPNVWPAFREALNIEGQRALGWAKAFEKVLQWYAVARIPIPAQRTEAAAAAAAAAEFSAARLSLELYKATAAVLNPGARMLRAAKLLSDMRGLTAAEKSLVLLDFLKRIGFVIKGAVVDEGPHLMMIANDGRFAIRILKTTGEILYGRFNVERLEYVFEALR